MARCRHAVVACERVKVSGTEEVVRCQAEVDSAIKPIAGGPQWHRYQVISMVPGWVACRLGGMTSSRLDWICVSSGGPWSNALEAMES